MKLNCDYSKKSCSAVGRWIGPNDDVWVCLHHLTVFYISTQAANQFIENLKLPQVKP